MGARVGKLPRHNFGRRSCDQSTSIASLPSSPVVKHTAAYSRDARCKLRCGRSLCCAGAHRGSRNVLRMAAAHAYHAAKALAALLSLPLSDLSHLNHPANWRIFFSLRERSAGARALWCGDNACAEVRGTRWTHRARDNEASSQVEGQVGHGGHDEHGPEVWFGPWNLPRSVDASSTA